MERKWYKKHSKDKKPSKLSKLVTKKGLPKPLEVSCFECRKKFFIKYVAVSKSYGRKNNWEYWTNPKSWEPDFWKDKEARKKDKQICSNCLLKLFYDKERFWETVKDLKKRQRMRTYIYTGLVE